MNVSYNGFGENILTMECDEGLKAGVLVTLKDDGKVYGAKDGDAICGYAVNVREGYAAVKLAGYAELPVESAVNVGFVKLSAASGTALKEDTNGRECLVVSSGTDTIGVIL